MLACGHGTSFLVNNEGEMHATGLNNNLQLGIPHIEQNCTRKNCIKCRKSLSHEYVTAVGVEACPNNGFSKVTCCCENGAVFERHNGSLFTWGSNSHGQTIIVK